ncbi:MAG TPA: protein kinase [Aridibacter sp.]|nr:protein kinase [Aridibacter sp.]
MSFCHECGSEISEAEEYCPVCGIALRSPVLENVEEEEPEEPRPETEASAESSAPKAEEPSEPPATSEPVEEPPQPLAEAVPEDEFVDISALRGDDDEEQPVEPSEADEAAETSTSFEDVPAEGPVAAEPEEKPAEPVKPSIPDPPAPEILGSEPEPPAVGETGDEFPVESAAPFETPDSPSTEVRPADEVIQTPLPSEPGGAEEEAPAILEKPADEVLEASPEASAPVQEEPAAEPEPEAAETEAAKEAFDAAPPEEPVAAKAEEPDEPAEIEDKAEEDHDFREDATLIAMPFPTKEVSAAKRAASNLESPTSDDVEIGGESQPEKQGRAVKAASPEREPESEQPEPKLEVEAAAEASAPADEGEDGPGTTPNIGGGDTDGSKAPKLKPLSEGTVLNSRYEIVRKIGGGGMGAVYLASDKNLGGVLRAVKEMVQSYIEEDQQEKAVQDFKRESMLLTSLEHPSIPTIYDYFFDEDAHRFYLVMKYISGGDLAARLRAAPEGKLEEPEVVEWAIQIADVLDYLHNRQPPIVYRDLKPANVMLDGNSGKVMLIDFGIARWINKEEKGVTAVGTMGYAPPELFSGNVVPSSDIYSLGSTVFHLVTGADPQNNPLLIFDFEKNPRPRQINPRLSDQMESILMRAVEYNSEKRFSSAAEMRAALTDQLSNLNAGNVTYGKTESPKSVGFSDQSVFCGFCGQKIVATDLFCAFCGAKQPLAQPGVHSAGYVPVELTAKLFIEGTSQLDYPSFDLAKDENLVGRRDPMSNIFPEVDLSKFDPQTKISRKHARIWRDGKKYMLEDLGSSNGTLLIPASNETVRLAPHQAQELTHGDRIKLGDTMLHFVISA